MKRSYFLLPVYRTLTLLLILIYIVSAAPAHSQNGEQLKGALTLSWETVELADGVYWKSYRGDDVNNSRLSINLIEVHLNRSRVRFEIAIDDDSLHQTSRLAMRRGALAAINGSFFNRSDGDPIPFLKIDGDIVSEGIPRRDLYIEKGGIAIAENGDLTIVEKPDSGWASIEYPTVMSSGPLLIYSGELAEPGSDPFHENRHPRTAVALTNDNRLYLVTIDGRSFQSYGMTIRELTEFLKALGAVHALNLDGGGSTTMWVDSPLKTGIVNYPSDNLEFDHAGERTISNALLIIQ